jgi:hypothetical protein
MVEEKISICNNNSKIEAYDYFCDYSSLKIKLILIFNRLFVYSLLEKFSNFEVIIKFNSKSFKLDVWSTNSYGNCYQMGNLGK